MKATRVVNLYKEPYDVYIGRPGKGNPGPWGNPFSAKRDGITVEESIRKYEEYIAKRLDNEPELMKQLGLLRGKTLGCFCKPGPCHGDVLANLANMYEYTYKG